EYESDHPNEARAHFEKAARFWSDDLPDAATVEATCYRGLLDALAGKSPGGRGMLEKGVHQARTMGRLSLEAQCRVHLARIDVGEGRYEEAIAALDGIPSGSDRSIGGEPWAA